MNMIELNRDIIVDLLPAYFSGEASEQTRQAVEKYFERDPEFARMANSMNEKLLQTVPMHLPENHQMQTLRRTQTTIAWRVVALGIVLAFIMAAVLVAMTFYMLQ
jgi:anti-sigma factor RsiW